MTSHAVPKRLAGVVNQWRESGEPAQPGIAWPRARWLKAFPEHTPVLSELPASLNREAVRSVAVAAKDGLEAAASALLVVMAWGYGRVGYGVSRASQALGAAHAPQTLFEAAIAVEQRGPLAGYELLTSHRIPRLGPAFGTKFLALSSTRHDSPPLILDRVVADWLRRNTELRLNPVSWSGRTYGRYLTAMYSWASSLDVPPEAVELCVFRDESRRVGNQWAEE